MTLRSLFQPLPPFSARGLTMVACIVLLMGCASTKMHDDGMRLMDEGQEDEGLKMLQESARLDPTNAGYRIDMLKQLDRYTDKMLKQADAARQSGDVQGALDGYARILKLRPSSALARRGLASIELDARTDRLVADSVRLQQDGRLDLARDKVRAALAVNPSFLPAKEQQGRLINLEEKANDARAEKLAAQSIMNNPVTLQFRDANLRMVFEALSRTSGLNLILDRDVRSDLKTTIFVKDAPISDTVDLILLQNQLEKRTVNSNTLFIFPATAAKQKEYQDLQVRTFQVSNADVKYLQTMLKTVLKLKDISVDERSNTLVMRDTPDAIAVAAKVIAAHDVPDAEVMLEVQVLEVSLDRLQNLGIQLPTSFGLSTPAPTGGALTLGVLRGLSSSDLVATPLSTGLNFQLQDTDTNILASPQIRARNKEKAHILIGDRIPTITNTVTPVQSGSGVVTGSVQYQDVGLKLDFEPQVYSDQEVGIRVTLEVSSIVREISGPNGSLAYQIGTRNAQTAVRLRDGETQIMGGLINAQDRNVAAKIPGLGHLPVVGRIFGNNNTTNNKTEIVMTVTPHILRAPALPDPALLTVYSGTEDKLRERGMQLDAVSAVRMQSTNGSNPANAAQVMPGQIGGGGGGSPTVGTVVNGTAPTNMPQVPASTRALLPYMNSVRNAAGLPSVVLPTAAAPSAAPALDTNATGAPGTPPGADGKVVP